MDEVRTIIVCNWHECPFVADATSRFAEAYGLTPREREVLEQHDPEARHDAGAREDAQQRDGDVVVGVRREGGCSG